ncbi:hypothetical protein [Amycolatopsis cihanbeyliensis]|uniref:Putative lipoprotein with Yx(FWY)xxD motif n=1 Tax=Amycolatopsis cihanbeyliensis TaxID=1128664 RepID=A0A542DRB0_AMYCI|nr:hypothetical protein [Amycolatopsis cihanbeyliensis]TQJ05515.1 putative lipoprotein with Yx(FWY)xxD motif [Amycolatopsis cihanbeyliensis]
MFHKRIVVPLASAAAGLLALSGCAGLGESGGGASNDDPAPVADTSQAAGAGGGAPAGQVTLSATEVDGVGEAVTDQDGFTLYRFDKDTAKPPVSNCAGSCAQTWPPVVADGQVDVQGVDANLVGSVRRTDGSEQVTIGGWPVYRYAEDGGPGESSGQGVGGAWYAVNPTGGKAGAAQQDGAAGTTLIADEAEGVGRIVTDAEGFSLYLFTDDTKEPSKSNCEGECAQNWPPVIAEGTVDVRGVDENLVSTVERADGSEQVTIGGWPVYRYAEDTEPGQANGHGVGGKWYAMMPEGCKSEAPPVEESGSEESGSGSESAEDGGYSY